MLFKTSHVHEAFQAEALTHKTKRIGQLWLKSAQERNVQVPSDSVNCKTAFTQVCTKLANGKKIPYCIRA